jgi:hypothetical protein
MTSLQRPHCQNPGACAAAKPTTHCRRCWGHHLKASIPPEVEQRRRAIVSSSVAFLNRERWNDPAYRAKITELARLNAVLLSPEVRAKRDTPECRKRAQDRRRATIQNMSASERRARLGKSGNRIGMTAEELALYDTLLGKGVGRDEARRMVEDYSRAQVRRKTVSAR